MAATPSRPRRSISPWWGLLLLPLPLGIGWVLADLPSAPRRAETATASAVGEAESSAPAPAASEKPREWWQPGGEKEAAELRWMTVAEAMAESKESGKPILLDFNAEWCPPCQMLKRTVFEDDAVSRKIGGAVIAVSVVDRAREEGQNSREIEDLQGRYQIDAFPTLVVLSPATGRWEKVRGFGGPGRTVDWILQTAASVK